MLVDLFHLWIQCAPCLLGITGVIIHGLIRLSTLSTFQGSKELYCRSWLHCKQPSHLDQMICPTLWCGRYHWWVEMPYGKSQWENHKVRPLKDLEQSYHLQHRVIQLLKNNSWYATY